MRSGRGRYSGESRNRTSEGGDAAPLRFSPVAPLLAFCALGCLTADADTAERLGHGVGATFGCKKAPCAKFGTWSESNLRWCRILHHLNGSEPAGKCKSPCSLLTPCAKFGTVSTARNLRKNFLSVDKNTAKDFRFDNFLITNRVGNSYSSSSAVWCGATKGG